MFIQKAIAVHGNTYDYSKVVYVRSRDKVIIICKTHGEFSQTPSDHLSGQGCRVCGYAKMAKQQTDTNESFIKKAIAVHGNTYDYSKVEYKSSEIKINIQCPSHGIFYQTPTSHLSGRGCRTCSYENGRGKADTTESFIKKANSIFGDEFDYSKVVYCGQKTKVKIICKQHGIFESIPNGHLGGHGCRNCHFGNLKDTTASFIKKAISVHGDLYDYSDVNYISTRKRISISCKKHGLFNQIAYMHIKGHGCPMCGHVLSKKEEEIRLFIESLGITTVSRYRPKWFKGKEIDIFIPSHNLAIEYNGSYWHSEEKKGRTYHYEKWKTCKENGVTLITINDFLYNEKPDKYHTLLRHKLGIDIVTRIYARKCKIVDLERAFAWQFVKDNHIEGKGRGWTNNAIIRGLEYNNEIVMIAVCDKGNIERTCGKNGTMVIGGVSKLYKTFPPGTIMMTTNDTGSTGDYGERLNKYTLRYWWVNSKLDYYPRRACQKHLIQKRFKIDMTGHTETSAMTSLGFIKVFDSGLSYFALRNSTIGH